MVILTILSILAMAVAIVVDNVIIGAIGVGIIIFLFLTSKKFRSLF